VEVHLTDISAREEFRRFSYVSLVAEKVIVGQGFDGYGEAIRFFAEKSTTDGIGSGMASIIVNES